MFLRLQFSSGSSQTADYLQPSKTKESQRLSLVVTKFVFIEAYVETHTTQKQSTTFTEMLKGKVNFYSLFKLQQALNEVTFRAHLLLSSTISKGNGQGAKQQQHPLGKEQSRHQRQKK